MNAVTFVLGSPARSANGWTVAVVPEGYTQQELDSGVFDIDVVTFVLALLATPPFGTRDIVPLLNVVQVPAASNRNGNTIKLLTPPQAVSPFDTAFGAMYGNDVDERGRRIERSLWGDSAKVREFVHGRPGLKEVNHILVVVNNTRLDGGSMHDDVGWFSKARADWPKVAIHELGHQAFALADEYPYENTEADPPRVFTGTEPREPNVTTRTSVDTMKWGPLLTLPQSLVPTTVRAVPCVREHPVVPATPPVPADAVGAYEGAHQHDCGIFRPSADCAMRHSAQPFCPVCEHAIRADIGHTMIVQGGGATASAGAWTHMQSFPMGPAARMLAYDALSGAYAVSSPENFFVRPGRRPDGTPPLDLVNLSVGTGNIGGDWTSLVPFTTDGTLHYFGHAFGSGAQAVFRMNKTRDTLTEIHHSPAGQAAHTHVVPLVLDGAPHCIGYNTFTGDAELFRLADGTGAPALVTTMRWGAGHTAVLAVPVKGDTFVLTYRLTTGEVMVRHVTASGFTMSFASRSGFWQPKYTHLALLDAAGRPFVLRHCALDGTASIHHLRADGSGVDFVRTVEPEFGPGALSLLGVGAPVMGRTSLPDPAGPGEDMFFYNATRRTLRVDPLTLR
ncbi:M64 family metallopeptidase [Streptomyces purpureus]|uniref:M64 family metallopeptidase n=1 Tax=Streptomyces purpureus TaxID=1951 RepID=UPI000367E0BD|nr:M64 family metallopeptidase [Streptomyces purpureus]